MSGKNCSTSVRVGNQNNFLSRIYCTFIHHHRLLRSVECMSSGLLPLMIIDHSVASCLSPRLRCAKTAERIKIVFGVEPLGRSWSTLFEGREFASGRWIVKNRFL